MRNTDDPKTSTDEAEAETFIGRWARRKRAAERPRGDGVEAPREADAQSVGEVGLPRSVQAAEETAGEAPSPNDVATTTPAPVLTDADMPDLLSLDADSDYSGFMSSGVSEALRTRALRQLFKSPQFNVLDGLNDYDDDFTSFEPLGDIVTSDMRHRLEVEAERAKREAEELALKQDQHAQALEDEQGVDSETLESVDAPAQDSEEQIAASCAEESPALPDGSPESAPELERESLDSVASPGSDTKNV